MSHIKIEWGGLKVALSGEKAIEIASKRGSRLTSHFMTKTALSKKKSASALKSFCTPRMPPSSAFRPWQSFETGNTGAHITRTKQYVFILAQYLITHPRFQGYLNPNTVELIHRSAPLHDIGKIAVPDRILLKPGPLTPEEFEEMKKHTWHGYNAIQRAEEALGNTQSSFLHLAKEIALTHHEKWNGKGYPRGLAGDNIPISGRLMALADVYDALTSKRIYKDAASHQDAMDTILAERGKHFDPDIVDAFAGLADIFKNIAENITDDV